jgi:hypothetical protein
VIARAGIRYDYLKNIFRETYSFSSRVK